MKFTKLILVLILATLIFGCENDDPQTTTKNPEKTAVKPDNAKPLNPAVEKIIKENPEVITDENGNRKYQLNLKMKLNETRKHEIFNVTRVAQIVGGVEKSNSYKDLINYTETPIRRIDESVATEVKYLNIEKSFENEDGVTLLVDTSDINKSKDKATTLIFQVITQIPLTLHINPLAQIEKVEGSDDIVNAAMSKIFGDKQDTHPDAKTWRDSLTKNFNESELKETFHEGFFHLPEKPIAVNEVWEDEVVLTLRSVGQAAFKLNLTVTGVKKVKDELIAEMKISGKVDIENENTKINNDLGITESSYEGYITFNITTGSYGIFKRKAVVLISAIDSNNKVTKTTMTLGKEEKVSVYDPMKDE